VFVRAVGVAPAIETIIRQVDPDSGQWRQRAAALGERLEIERLRAVLLKISGQEAHAEDVVDDGQSQRRDNVLFVVELGELEDLVQMIAGVEAFLRLESCSVVATMLTGMR